MSNIESLLTFLLVTNLAIAGVMYVMAYKHGYKNGVDDTNTPF
jgi:hypothetical protein